MRTVVLATELGRRRGLSGEALRDVYYTSLLRYLGCTGFSHEEAHLYGAGNDIATRNVMAMADAADPVGTVGRIVKGVGREGTALERVRAVGRLLGDGRAVEQHSHSQCEVSIRLASLVGVSPGVRASLSQICERFDGRGAPGRIAGEALDLAIRLAHVADVAEIEHHRSGREAALAVVRRRAGGQFDPELAAGFVADAPELFAAIEGPTVWDRFLEQEPEPRALAPAERVDDVAMAFGFFADLKSTFTLGHSTGVAALAERAGASLGLDYQERRQLRRVAWLHDLGRVSVPNSVWDKPERLSAAEWERVRLHAYYTERILWQVPALRDIARFAAAAHERLDGAGYHRAVPAPILTKHARILAVADAYHAMSEPRAHRPPLERDRAARLLHEDVAAGRLDREVTEAVLEAAGAGSSKPRKAWPKGLSDREVEVLRLVARGRSNKEVAQALGISARTVQHHVLHIYQKIEVSSRAAAALFTIENDLLG
jgi:HD-GYP domain-containing protein (c-di-GMP phosphodiesterase class II)/DNA-binding CsgD family transcriptional regulator